MSGSNRTTSSIMAVRALSYLAVVAALSAVCSTASFGCDDCGKKKDAATTLASDPSMDFILKLDSRKAGIQSHDLQSGANSTSINGSARSDVLNGGTNSTTLTGGAGSTTLQTGTNSTMLHTGSDTTMLQVGTKSTALNIGTASTLIQGNVQRESQPVNVLILLDTSMTMKQGMDGLFPSKMEVKIDVAKRVLQETSAAIPPQVKVGLRVFGGGTSHNQDSDCHQSALLVPIETGNRKSLVSVAMGVKPAGVTPLGYALSQVPDDFQDLQGIRRVVLITDGMDTCGGDPCGEIKRLSRLGYKMKVDIVGMGLKHDQTAKDLFNCIAQNSGGKYYDADTAAELAKGLKESLADAVGEGTVSAQVLPRAKSLVLPAQLPAPSQPSAPAKLPAP
jgi:hypothetical protein